MSFHLIPMENTVPVLWDKERSCIVNNDSSEIMRMLNSAFNDFATGSFSELNLYPADVELRGTIDKWTTLFMKVLMHLHLLSR